MSSLSVIRKATTVSLEERAATGRRLIERVDPRVMVVVGALLIGLTWVQLVPDEFRGVPRHQYADSTADWLVTRAAVDGLDPYRDLRELSQQLKQPYVPAWLYTDTPVEYVHPRVPGAMVLSLPALLVAPETWFLIMLAVSAISAAGTLVVARDMFEVPHWWMVVALIIVVVSGQIHTGVFYGTQSLVIAFALTVGWSWLRKGADLSAGILIGTAATLKLFPLLALVPLVAFRRWRAVGSALATFVTLNAVGLALFTISPQQALDGLSRTSSVWIRFSGNGSLSLMIGRLGFTPQLAGLVSWLLVTGVFLWFLRQRRAFDSAIALALALSVLGAPVSWEHYVAVGLPCVAHVLSVSRERIPVGLSAIWVMLLTIGRFLPGLAPSSQALIVGLTTFTMGVVLSAAIWAAARGAVTAVKPTLRSVAPGST